MNSRILFLVFSTLPATALAFFGTTIKVGVRDAETNKPLGGAFVVVREFAEVGKLHGSMSYCVRAQAAAADAPSLTLGLPHPGTDLLTKARALEGFAYRIELGPGVFLLAGALAVLIALATVSYQSVKAATADPVNSLRYE